MRVKVSTADTKLLSMSIFVLAFVIHGVEQLTGISLDVSLHDVVPHIHIV